jgi:hypothetical protein
MPYYRILIMLKNQQKPIQGIRFIENHNIDVVYNMVQSKAKTHYNESTIKDVEVQMLPKRCRAVLKFIEDAQKRQSGKRNNNTEGF